MKKLKRAVVSVQFLRKNADKPNQELYDQVGYEQEKTLRHLAFRRKNKNDLNDVPPAVGPDHQIEVFLCFLFFLCFLVLTHSCEQVPPWTGPPENDSNDPKLAQPKSTKSEIDPHRRNLKSTKIDEV